MRSVLWSLGILFGGPLAHAAAPVLQPYVATYAVSYRGIDAGTITMQLSRDPTSSRYTFETRANPSALARLVIGRDAIERTIVEPTEAGIRPVKWHLEDGKNGKDGDGDLTFDWSANKVTGEYEGKPVELPTQPGLQDRLSIQLAVSAALVQGREPASIVMVNGDKTREYTYARGETAQLDTKIGKQATIVYESTRPSSNRVSRVWHAPDLEYLPVRAEQIREGKVETVMQLVTLERK
jgi:Protein of unknown function (DUF3108)